MLYRLCEKLAGVIPPWYAAPPVHESRRQWVRRQLADNLFMRTLWADRGADQQAHGNDWHRTCQMASLLRSDMTPAAAVEYLDGPF